MLSKRWFRRLAMLPILAVLLYAGTQLVLSQDSAKTYKDDATGLLWAAKDNGSDVNWNQANNYCRNLSLEGQRDWRLPTTKELKTVYDKKEKKLFKSKAPIELTSEIVWAEPTGSGEAWAVNFLNGSTSLLPTMGGCSSTGRALCVRGSGE